MEDNLLITQPYLFLGTYYNNLIRTIPMLIAAVEEFGIYSFDKRKNSNYQDAINFPLKDWFYKYGKDYYSKMSFFYYKKAADLTNNPIAQNIIANCYDKGTYTTKSIEKAIKYYKKSAENGYARAQYNLFVCYKYGHGVEKSIELAQYWLNKAVEQNTPFYKGDLNYIIDNENKRYIGYKDEESRYFNESMVFRSHTRR